MAFRLAFYRELGKPFYVMVQHGFPRLVMEVGPSRREVAMSPMSVARKWNTFRKWSAQIQRLASGSNGKERS
ncbi:hypothetical protein OKA04_23320 [Luteolibacter flavescens]|uniref:Uncharacterized protein n=1 Tax=Luteolibacter flavescens TaxID=1859460 RepID=A0ABT3FVW3_9BACT|nr:hypothetical protein [Luteolibacter flavescens]MCW1887687.1 hypothetical protein [Luteolibacter flavescens]